MSKDINGFFPIKILFLGTSNVGKTSLIKRLINREDYNIEILHEFTVTLDIYLKAFQIEGQLIKCELWDTPGILGAVIDNMIYIKYVNVLIFVFDLSSRDSFTEMKTHFSKYKDLSKQLKLKNDAIIIGNKLDKIDKRQISFEEINDFAITNNVNFYEISAKDNKTGYSKIFKIFKKIGKNFLVSHKIIQKNTFFDIIKFRHISRRDDRAVKPSLIYKQIDVFVKTLHKLFPVEENILQIINNINDFYKSNVYKKLVVKNFEDLKNLVYNLEKLREILIDVAKIVSLKYNVNSQVNYQNKKKQKNEPNNEQKSLLESDVSKNELTLVLFIESTIILRQSIFYCIHDYIINFMFAFNNETVINKRLNMIIKEDNIETELIFKYFCDIKNKKMKILSLFNDNYVKYFSSSELHQYYLFIRNIDFLFNYMESIYKDMDLSTFLEKGEYSFNELKDYIYANNKEYDKIKNEGVKKMSNYEIEKNIINYSKKCLKYYKSVLNKYNEKYINDKGLIFECIKIRLYLSNVYNFINKGYDSSFYFYSALLLIIEYLKNKKETKKNKNNENKNKESEKEIIDLFNKIKDNLFKNIDLLSLDMSQKKIKEIKRKIKYYLNNSIDFILLYNQQLVNVNLTSGQNSLTSIPQKINFDFFSSTPITFKIFKSLEESVQIDEKMRTKIKLYDIYSDSLKYYKKELYNMFFKCLDQKFKDKESLLSYDGKNITSLKVDYRKIENILYKYEFLPSDIAQLFNIIGISLMKLFRRNIKKDNINEKEINLFKSHKKIALALLNAGLNDKLIIKAKELDETIAKQLKLEKPENNYIVSLEKIRICIRINISMILLIKNNNEINKIFNLVDNYLYKSSDFPINYPLERQKEFFNVLYIDSISAKSNVNGNDLNDKIINFFPKIENYLPIYKNERDDIEYLNYFINLNNNIDEFDLINALMADSNPEAYNKNLENFITPQNFKEKFTQYYNNSTGEEKELFATILNKENLGNINFWKRKFDNKQGKGFLFNPIYMNYISKYYNININLYSICNKNENKLEFIKTISLGLGRKYYMNIITDKNINTTYKVFIPLIKKDEIFKYEKSNIKSYLNNLYNRAQEYKDSFPDFSNLLFWEIINKIKLIINNNIDNGNTMLFSAASEDENEEIIKLYLDCMYNLGLHEQIINFINENISTSLKGNKEYYITLFNSYKKLCLYDYCIETIKKYLYENNSDTSEKVLNYEIVQKIRDLQKNDFYDVYNYYKNLEIQRPIEFVKPLMDDDLFQILNDKYKNSDDNIFNLEAQLFEEKVEKNEKLKLKKDLEKLKDGNKFRILFIEGAGIKSLIQLIYLCEIENYLQKPIAQIFDCIVTSKDGLFISGLLTTQNEKGEVKYHANDVLKIFYKQKETIYNKQLKKELKLNLLRNLFNLPEIIGNLYYYDERCQGLLKIGNNDLIIDLYENYIDMINDKINDKNESYISLNNILRIIQKRIKKDNLYLMYLGKGIYPFNNTYGDIFSQEKFILKRMLGEQFLYLDIPLNSCNDEGKYSFQSLDNQFNELLMNCNEYFSEIKENKKLFFDKLGKFFKLTNS